MLHLNSSPEYVKAVQDDRIRKAQRARQRQWLNKRPQHDRGRRHKQWTTPAPLRGLAGNR